MAVWCRRRARRRQAEAALRANAEAAIAAFGPAFDELNFSDALKLLWAVVAETDGYLTANAPWKKPPERSDEEHAKLQARVLATAAEAIRVITALAYPIVPDAAAKVWAQLGLGELAVAAKNGFLSELAWGGLKAGTKFGEPAPLFPRAEKEVIERMQSLEDENSRTAVEAAGGGSAVEEAKTPSVAQKREPAAAQVSPLWRKRQWRRGQLRRWRRKIRRQWFRQPLRARLRQLRRKPRLRLRGEVRQKGRSTLRSMILPK